MSDIANTSGIAAARAAWKAELERRAEKQRIQAEKDREQARPRGQVLAKALGKLGIDVGEAPETGFWESPEGYIFSVNEHKWNDKVLNTYVRVRVNMLVDGNAIGRSDTYIDVHGGTDSHEFTLASLGGLLAQLDSIAARLEEERANERASQIVSNQDGETPKPQLPERTQAVLGFLQEVIDDLEEDIELVKLAPLALRVYSVVDLALAQLRAEAEDDLYF
jgi:hypothetical protein